MVCKLSRRRLIGGTAAIGTVAALGRFPAPAIARSPSIKVGLLTVLVVRKRFGRNVDG
jgi:hypothetical protein